MSPIRIVIADDHLVVREGLRTVLQVAADFLVVGEAASGPEAVVVAESLQPDVLLLDLSMPGLHGIDVARQVTARCPSTRVLVLSMHSSEIRVARAFQAGAAGYVLKDAGVDELIEAIRQVASGGSFLGSGLPKHSVSEFLRLDLGPVHERYQQLSPREQEVFRLGAQGCTMAEIARRLSIGPRTVETHRENLMRKLGIRNQTELVQCALSLGLIPLKQ